MTKPDVILIHINYLVW